MTSSDTPTADRPRSVAELARGLGVDRSTLWRALMGDPTAPKPADRDDLDRPLYQQQKVTAWWPNRRRRGRPTNTQPPTVTREQAADLTVEQVTAALHTLFPGSAPPQ